MPKYNSILGSENGSLASQHIGFNLSRKTDISINHRIKNLDKM